ncbi:hypothetical protein [Mesorhizobium sp. ISC11]|uniref:hypothetical protein n=1 Tax=Mesorhizobium sp. ISC11 TaxID=3076428 RepID=UPI00301C8B7E
MNSKATTIDRRRLLLGTGATAAGLGALSVLPPNVAANLASTSPTPDERITAAIEEIKAAFWEKWPDAPLRIMDIDNIADGMVIILSHVEADKPGDVRYERTGLARLLEGGAS